MENYQVSVVITDKMIGDSNEFILAAGNSFDLNFEDNDGKVLEICRFCIEDSYRIEFDETTGKALNSNMFIASTVGDEKKITEVFFGYSELVANLMLFERNIVLKTRVKPYISVLHETSKKTKDESKNEPLASMKSTIRGLFNKNS